MTKVRDGAKKIVILRRLRSSRLEGRRMPKHADFVRFYRPDREA